MFKRPVIISYMFQLGLSARNAELKLSWAKAHLKLLDHRIEKFVGSQPYTFGSEEDLENQRYILRFNMFDVPDYIPLIAGDAIYNMRASLDQLVWSLARLNGIPKRVSFPIIDSPVLTRSKLDSFNKSLVGVPQEAVCQIAALQPYHRGDAYKTHPLWRLDEMCNLDKHRRIPANGSASILTFPNLTAKDRSDIAIEATETCFVMSVPLSLKHKLGVYPTIQYSVNFGGDTSGINEGFGGLLEIYNFIADSVLPVFKKFLFGAN